MNAVLLAVVWAALTGSFTLPNFVFGIVLGWLSLYLVREQLDSRGARYRSIGVLSLGGLFVRELVLSAWRVAKLVLSPKMDIRPGIFAYPLTVDRDFEIMLLANLITLTPGTLSVDVSADRRTLFVHAIDCTDVDGMIREIQNGFERKIKEAFR